MLEWTKKHDEFSEAYKKAKDLQKEMLIQNGLRGLYNAAAFIFTAKNIIGWRDKQEHEHIGKGGGPIQVQFGSLPRPERGSMDYDLNIPTDNEQNNE